MLVSGASQLLVLTVSSLMCRSGAIQHPQTLLWAKTAAEAGQMPLCLLCFSAWFYSQHIWSPSSVESNSCPKALQWGCFYEQLVHRRACQSSHLHSEPKWGGQTLRGEISLWQLLVKDPLKTRFFTLNLTSRVQYEKQRLWGLDKCETLERLFLPLSQQRGKNKTLLNRVRTASQGRRFVC